jgi:hypothetical protein
MGDSRINTDISEWEKGRWEHDITPYSVSLISHTCSSYPPCFLWVVPQNGDQGISIKSYSCRPLTSHTHSRGHDNPCYHLISPFHLRSWADEERADSWRPWAQLPQTPSPVNASSHIWLPRKWSQNSPQFRARDNLSMDPSNSLPLKCCLLQISISIPPENGVWALSCSYSCCSTLVSL